MVHYLALCLPMFISIAHVASRPYGYTATSEKLTADGRTRGIRDRVNKDFVLGGLLPVHEEDPDSTAGRCKNIRRDLSVEAMLFAIDSVNANETLLPNITLGFDIRDSCYSENIGLDEAVDVIISGNQLNVAGCQSTEMESTNASILTVGIVGAAASRVSIPVASLGRLFQVPQVSFASTSPILSNRETYTYFYRTVPPDNLQAKVMVDIVLHFNWTQISIIYVGDSYGQPVAVELRKLAKVNNICIDLDREIAASFKIYDYQELAGTLLASDANVVILIVHEQNAELLLEAVANIPTNRRFIWIASDGWARKLAIAHMFNETVAGYYGIAPHAPHAPSFDDYLSQLTIQTNIRNLWFKEIFSAFTLCNSSNCCDQNTTPLTSLPNYAQDSFVPPTIDAVYAFANALHNFLEENCNFTSGWTWANQSCPGQKRELSGLTLLQYLRKVDFVNPLTGKRVAFDSLGNAAGMYEILNYQAEISNGVTQYSYRQVGKWSSTRINSSESEGLELFDNMTLQFGMNNSEGIVYQLPITQCGRCSLGEYRRTVASSCCGVCDPCLGRNYSDEPSATSCQTCPMFMWGNNPTEGSSDCVPIPKTYLKFNHPWSVVLMVLAILGLLGVSVVTIAFAVHWNAPVVKASGREQMVLLLIGITLSFIMAFVYMSPPVLGVCIVQCIGIWLALSLMFGALLVKIVRVARIFFNKTTLTHLKFTQPYYQIFFTLLLVLGQMIIVAGAIAYQVPSVHRDIRLHSEDNNRLPEVVITCDIYPIEFIIPSIVYESVIIILSTFFGVLSFRYPGNFNEAKDISFCTFAVLVIWVAFIITYFATRSAQEFRNAIISLGILMTAVAVLLTIFGRKVFIAVFHHEKVVDNFATECVLSQGNVLNNASRVKASSLTSLQNFGVKKSSKVKVNGATTSF